MQSDLKQSQWFVCFIICLYGCLQTKMNEYPCWLPFFFATLFQNKFPAAEKYLGMLEYFFAAGIEIDQKSGISFGKE